MTLIDIRSASESELDRIALAQERLGTGLPSLRFIDVTAWSGKPVPVRKWAVQDLIPAANVVIVSGHGATGKTTLVLQLCSATVLARSWLTYMPEPGPAMIVCCEDDADEIHRRLSRIAEHYNASFDELRDLKPLSLAGEDAVLGVPDRAGIIRPTPLFQRIRNEALALRPKIIALDNAADVYAGNENERGMVRQFITMLRGLAMESGAAVVLTLHPSLTGISTGTGISGNTAWFNSVRAHLYLKPAVTDSGDEPDKDLRELEARKNNYGPLPATTTLRWQDGVFLVERGIGGLDKEAGEQAVEALFLKLLSQFEKQGRTVSHKRSSSFAPTVFAEDPAAKLVRASKGALEAAMNRLFASNQIHVGTYGRPSRPYSKIVAGAAP
jgi:RecA-family ATPase